VTAGLNASLERVPLSPVPRARRRSQVTATAGSIIDSSAVHFDGGDRQLVHPAAPGHDHINSDIGPNIGRYSGAYGWTLPSAGPASVVLNNSGSHQISSYRAAATRP